MRTGWMAGATLAVALAACGGPTKEQKAAYAEAAKHYVPPTTVARAEYGAEAVRRFHKLDRDGDQYLTPDELPAGERADMAFDKDGDGRISADEWSKGMLARFDHDDVNHDGNVTSVERQTVRPAPAKGHPPH